MEGERRKRKLEEEEEEENEEQKMEKFFALIKSTKDARDLLSKEKTEKKVEEKKEICIWNPTFQLEDFIGCGESGKSNISVTHAAGPSETQKKKEKEVIEKEYLQEATAAAAATAAEAPADENGEGKEKASDHLDLNLSL